MTVLEKIKEDIGITYSDLDSQVQRTIERGEAFIDNAVGAAQDYEENGEAYSLLLSFVLYARSGVENEFKENYIGDIISLQIANSTVDEESDDED